MQGELEFPLIRTKLMIPTVRENLVHRQNLIQSIEAGISQGFVLISSPPGYGKTTLAADWAQQTSAPVAWLSLDPDDNDLPTFNRYLSVLCKTLFRETPTDEGVFQIETSPLSSLQSILTTLINACAGAGTELTLVLDDYHVIHNPQIHEGITFLLDHFPKGLRFILITRRDPPFSLARLRANSKIHEIRTADLGFSMEEVRSFLTQTHRLSLEESEIMQLYNTTEGWVTGLQLFSLVLNKSKKLRADNMTLSSETSLTIEYMVDEVLSQQPERIQQFLLRTSILENLNSSVCSYVLDGSASPVECQEYLNTLCHTNQFVSPLDNQWQWFRYHSLFAGALQHLLKEQYPDEISSLFERASEWCDQNGYPEEALSYAGKADNPQRTVTLLEKYAMEAVSQNRILEILRRIQRIDTSLLESSPFLSLIYSWGCLFSFDMDSGEIWLEKARKMIASSDLGSVPEYAENSFWGMVALEQSILKAASGENEEAMEYAKQAACLLPAENDFSHSFALLNQAVTLTIDAEIEPAVRILNETIRISQRAGNWFVLLLARSNLGNLYVSCGQLSKAQTIFEQTETFLSGIPRQFSAFEMLINKELGSICLARNQLAEAEDYFQRSLTGGQTGYMLNDFDTHIRLAYLYQSKGDPLRANAEFSQARALCSKSQTSLDDIILNLNEGKWALLRGQAVTAQKLLQNIDLLNQETAAAETAKVPKALLITAQLILIRLNLAQGQLTNNPKKYAQAKERLEQIMPELIARNLIEKLIEAYILSAFIAQEMNDPDQMTSALESALRLAEPESFRQVFINEGIPMSRALLSYLSLRKQRKITEDFPTREFVSDLLFRLSGKTLDREASDHASSTETEENLFLTELLTARENEIMQLVAKGRSNSEIASDLFISVNTVKRHLNNAYLKLGVSTRTQAVRVAQSQGLIN